MAPLNLRLLLLSLTGLYRITRASDAPQSITALPAYSQQRECATWCFFNGNRGEDLLGHAIGCCRADCAEPVANACYCRADLRPSAVSWLSLCVDTQCSTNAVDVSSAVALYDDYCGAAVTATVTESESESASKSESEPTQVTTRTVTTEPPATARTVVTEPPTTTQTAVTEPPPTRTGGGSGNTANAISATTIIVTHTIESGAGIRAQQVSSLSLAAVVVLTIILQGAIAGSAS